MFVKSYSIYFYFWIKESLLFWDGETVSYNEPWRFMIIRKFQGGSVEKLMLHHNIPINILVPR